MSGSAWDHVRCRLRFHDWPEYATVTWLEKPSVYRNEYGTAMEYRACTRCGRLRDVSAWLDVPDADYGFPRREGPFSTRRFREIMAGPRSALVDPPLPWEVDGTVVSPRSLPSSWRDL